MDDAERKAERRAIDQLDKRLDQLKTSSGLAPKPKSDKPMNTKGIGQGMKMAMDMVAAVAVGVAIGWILDYLFGTLPLFFLIFFALGSAAGVLNVYRSAKSLETDMTDERRRRIEEDRKKREEDPAALDDLYDEDD